MDTVWSTKAFPKQRMLRICYLDTSVSNFIQGLPFNAGKSPLNLIRLRSIGKLGLLLDSIYKDLTAYLHLVRNRTDTQFNKLQQKFQNISKEFPNLFKEKLGCLKDAKLDIKVKSDAKLKFCKPRPFYLALQDDLNAAYIQASSKVSGNQSHSTLKVHLLFQSGKKHFMEEKLHSEFVESTQNSQLSTGGTPSTYSTS